MKSGIELITEERERNRAKYGDAHDDAHAGGEIIEAVIACLAPGVLIDGGTESVNDCRRPQYFDRPCFGFKVFVGKTEIDHLVIAGALIAAEIDRLQRVN